ncbi:unnamed protein product, partial [Polarella glacialis]
MDRVLPLLRRTISLATYALLLVGALLDGHGRLVPDLETSGNSLGFLEERS